MGQLSDWSKQNSRFFKIEDGETVRVVYEGFKIAKSSFDADREVISYTVKTSEGRKIWNTSSAAVAEFLDKVKQDKTVSITRSGSGKNTKYQLSVVEATESNEDLPEEPEPNQSET